MRKKKNFRKIKRITADKVWTFVKILCNKVYNALCGRTGRGLAGFPPGGAPCVENTKRARRAAQIAFCGPRAKFTRPGQKANQHPFARR